MRPSIYIGTNKSSEQKQIKNNQNRINKISNRLFILSPVVINGKDIECSKSDFF